MRWMIVILVVVALVLVTRVGFILRRARTQSRDNDWDARMVRDLRASGANAFTAYEVDFFFSLPDEQACASLRQTLEPEGFMTDTRGMGGDATGFSLHASKRLRVSVTEMQGLSERFRTLAQSLGGNYDGWTTDPTRV